MLNKIILIGRLTRDPELKYTESGVAYCFFTLAVDRNFKNASGERETDFIDIIVWRQQAENCANYLAKGKLAAVEGNLFCRSHEDKEGNKHRFWQVNAEQVWFLSPRDNGSREEVAAASEDEHTGYGSGYGSSDTPW